MTTDIKDPAWDSLSYAEKNRVLFDRQKKMLEEFLERGAISKAQYQKIDPHDSRPPRLIYTATGRSFPAR